MLRRTLLAPVRSNCRRKLSSAASSSGSNRKFGPYSWASATLAVATLAGCAAYYQHLRDKKVVRSKNETAGKAMIGGPFTLVDATAGGTPVTDLNFRGKYMLVYFGFTFCPDICPAELRKLARALDQLAAAGLDSDHVVPLFITLDPERDSVENVRRYCAEFHSRLHGLTGTPEQIHTAARAYRVYSTKVEEEGAEADDYVVDHSIFTMLMDRNGQFIDVFGRSFDATQIANGVLKHVREREPGAW